MEIGDLGTPLHFFGRLPASIGKPEFAEQHRLVSGMLAEQGDPLADGIRFVPQPLVVVGAEVEVLVGEIQLRQLPVTR